MVSLRCLVQEDNIRAPVEEQPPSWARRVPARRQDQPMVWEKVVIGVPLLTLGARYLQRTPIVLYVMMEVALVINGAPEDVTTSTDALISLSVMGRSVTGAVLRATA